MTLPGFQPQRGSSGMTVLQTYRYVLLPDRLPHYRAANDFGILGDFQEYVARFDDRGHGDNRLKVGRSKVTLFMGTRLSPPRYFSICSFSMTLLFMMRKIESRSRIPGWLSRENAL